MVVGLVSVAVEPVELPCVAESECPFALFPEWPVVMPEPNIDPELELPGGCPRAVDSGIEYSFAAGLPGSR